MKFAIIENGTVKNIILASEDFISKSNISGVFSDIAEIGDTFQNGEFVKNKKIEALVFKEIKPMYMRLALDQFGLLDAIEAALNMPENKVKKIAFEYALAFERNDEMINGFAQAFGLSESQVDDIFKYAESIQQ